MSTVHRRDFLSSALLAAGGLAASGLTLPLTAMAQTGDIVLGQSAPLSGSFAGQGTAYRDGALLFFNQINASGGINGRKIQLITLDDGYKAETAAENAKKLIEQENVLALFNFMFTRKSLVIILFLTIGGGVFYAVKSSSTKVSQNEKYEKILQLF